MNISFIISFIKGWSRGFLICVSLFVLLGFASIISHNEQAKIRAHIVVGLQEIESLNTTKDNWTDCLVISGTIVPDLNLLEYFGSPKLIIDKPCSFIDAALLDTSKVLWNSYDRYWHGSVYLATVALRLFDLSVVQYIYKFAMVLSLICLCLAGFKLKHDLRVPLILVCLGVFTGVGINSYGGHLGHSPTYFLPLFAFAVFIVLGFDKLTIFEAATFGAVIGTIAGYFDLLSGGIPFSLAMSIFVWYLLWLNIPLQDQKFKGLFIGIAILCLAYVFSVFMLVTIKLFSAAVLLGHPDAIPGFKGELLWRMSGEEINAEGRLDAAAMAAKELWVHRDYAFIGGAKGGSIVFWVGGFAWILALCVSWYNYIISRNTKEILYFLMPFLAAMVVPLWFLVFSNHGFIHAWFMTRVICLIPVFGIVSVYMCLVRCKLNRSSLDALVN